MSDDNVPLRLEWVHPDDLNTNPLNWRRHPPLQRDALDALLYGEDAVGWAGAALYNEATGRLIDGHLRKEVAAMRDEPIPVLIGSWSEEQERLILATLDPIAALAQVDYLALGTLMQSVQANDQSVLTVLKDLAAQEGLYFGCNGDKQYPPLEDYESERNDAFKIKVHFPTEKDVMVFSELIGQTVTKETDSIWFPQRLTVDE